MKNVPMRFSRAPMRRTALAALVLGAAALGSAPALAADAIQAVPVAPIADEVPFTWTGGYIGAQVGWLDATDDNGVAIAGLGGAVDIDGFIGGLHAGYDLQLGSGIVLGVYADVDFSGADVDIEGVANGVGELDYVARGMGRIGYGLGAALVYGQLGVAYANADIDGVSGDLDSYGYAVGVGADYAVTNSVAVGADYLYHSFDDFDDIGGIDASEIDLDAHTVRAKFSYRF